MERVCKRTVLVKKQTLRVGVCDISLHFSRRLMHPFCISVEIQSLLVYFCSSPRLNFSKQGQLPELLRKTYFLRGIHAVHIFSDRAAESFPELARGALAHTLGTTIVLKRLQLKAVA